MITISFDKTLIKTLREAFPTIAIDEVADGSKVLQKVDSFLPDLIFMNIRLPGENSLELMKKIRAVHPDTKIVVLSSYDVPEYREAASKCGADRFLGIASLNSTGLELLIKSYQKFQ